MDYDSQPLKKLKTYHNSNETNKTRNEYEISYQQCIYRWDSSIQSFKDIYNISDESNIEIYCEIFGEIVNWIFVVNGNSYHNSFYLPKNINEEHNKECMEYIKLTKSSSIKFLNRLV